MPMNMEPKGMEKHKAGKPDGKFSLPNSGKRVVVTMGGGVNNPPLAGPPSMSLKEMQQTCHGCGYVAMQK